jgi:hypothetical protein
MVSVERILPFTSASLASETLEAAGNDGAIILSLVLAQGTGSSSCPCTFVLEHLQFSETTLTNDYRL